MHAAAMQLWIVDAVRRCRWMYGQSRRGSRGGRSAECGYALSFVFFPLSVSQPPRAHHPICPHRLRKAEEDIACSDAPNDQYRICMMNAQRWLVRLPWMPKPLSRPPMRESAGGSSKSRSLGYAVHHHLPDLRKLEVFPWVSSQARFHRPTFDCCKPISACPKAS